MQLEMRGLRRNAQVVTLGAATVAGSLMAAALALPGLMTTPALAESAPENATVAFKFLNYVDYQESGERMTVHSPAVYVQAPLKGGVALEGSFVLDTMSGASPSSYNSLSGASGKGIHDRRKAGDVKLTKFFDRTSVGMGYAFSRENDYDSNSGNIEGRWSTDSNNTTLALGLGYSSDEIGSSNDLTLHKTRRTTDVLIGLTQVLTPSDLLQSNLTYSSGNGYFSDPYKDFDKRPDERRAWAWLTRYVHYFSGPGAALHGSYRYYRNDWGVSAHTFEAAWYQPLPAGWLVRPSIRYYTQRSADFYRDPQPPPAPPLDAVGAFNAPLFTADTRLAAFGAVTVGLKIAKQFAKGWTIDGKYEWYRQREGWRLGSDGSPGVQDFTARWLQVGVSKRF